VGAASRPAEAEEAKAVGEAEAGVVGVRAMGKVMALA